MDYSALYQQYLSVWGKDFSGDPSAMRAAATIFAAMDDAASTGAFILAPNNKYYPSNYVPSGPSTYALPVTPPAAGGTTATPSTASPAPPAITGALPQHFSPATWLLIAAGLYLFLRK